MFQINLVQFKSLKILLVTHVMLRFSDTMGIRGGYDLDDGTGRIYGSWSNKAGQDYAAFSAMTQQLYVVILTYNSIRISNLTTQVTTVSLVSWAIFSSAARGSKK
jgi:hypothetical protein